ncbi:hypothetical protein P879_10806 [Paragonimus westermani]|uniref:Uncharacterized protein n=1 Tax=Paragonimus westermani TaxID=34504 RepID=A0A8T0D306_9TREM|nr:hypothetical protein P879_10806 [Paragonimus westermani]
MSVRLPFSSPEEYQIFPIQRPNPGVMGSRIREKLMPKGSSRLPWGREYNVVLPKVDVQGQTKWFAPVTPHSGIAQMKSSPYADFLLTFHRGGFGDIAANSVELTVKNVLTLLSLATYAPRLMPLPMRQAVFNVHQEMTREDMIKSVYCSEWGHPPVTTLKKNRLVPACGDLSVRNSNVIRDKLSLSTAKLLALRLPVATTTDLRPDHQKRQLVMGEVKILKQLIPAAGDKPNKEDGRTILKCLPAQTVSQVNHFSSLCWHYLRAVIAIDRAGPAATARTKTCIQGYFRWLRIHPSVEAAVRDCFACQHPNKTVVPSEAPIQPTEY